MAYFLSFIISVLIVGLFLYTKLTPFKQQLKPNYKKAFGIFENLFEPLLGLVKTVIRPHQVGSGIALDMSQIVILTLLLIVLNVIR